jgi:sugar O-acyltransferase (sialic acid O-acetyltransferase NeuD family)
VPDKEIILVGYSGHAYVLVDTALENRYRIVGYCDQKKADNDPYKLKYLGSETDDDFIGWKEEPAFIVGIGDNNVRQRIAKLIERKSRTVETIIHETACVSKSAMLGNGCFVNKNVSINALAVIGAHVILNTGCIIEHECIIGDAVHIAPGAVLAGNVRIGERTFVGANAVIKQGVVIGKDVVIGAGTVVLTDIPDGSRIVGNPGRQI